MTGPLRWTRPALARRQAESPLYAYVLDADTDLAEEFDLRSRVAARQVATARVVHVAVGACDLAPWFDAVGHGPGLLILDGVVAFQTRTLPEFAEAIMVLSGDQAAALTGVSGWR